MEFKQDFTTYTKDELIDCLIAYLSGERLSRLKENEGVYDVVTIEKGIQNIAAFLQRKYSNDEFVHGLLLLIPKKFKKIIQCPECKGRIDIIDFEDKELKECYGSDTMCYCHKCGCLDYLPI